MHRYRVEYRDRAGGDARPWHVEASGPVEALRAGGVAVRIAPRLALEMYGRSGVGHRREDGGLTMVDGREICSVIQVK